jgi:hypothetical protein
VRLSSQLEPVDLDEGAQDSDRLLCDVRSLELTTEEPDGVLWDGELPGAHIACTFFLEKQKKKMHNR